MEALPTGLIGENVAAPRRDPARAHVGRARDPGERLIENHRAAANADPQCVAYLSWNNVGPLTNDFVDTSARSLSAYSAFAKDAACAVHR